MLTCFLFGLVVLGSMFLVPLSAKCLRTSKQQQSYKYILFALYVGGLLWLTLINRLGMKISSVRFHPFHVVRQMLNCWFGFQKIAATTCKAVFRNSKNLLDSAHATPVEDLCLNIILFIPFGFLLPYLWPKLNFYKTVLLSLIFSILIEGFQYIGHLGCCDIDDVINDTLGTCIGYGCFVIYKKIAKK